MRERVLDGYLVKQTPAMSLHEIEAYMSDDSTLEKGLLFVGGAGQGKTNVIVKAASDILAKMEENDVAVFFDVKGDYYDYFYKDGDMVLSPTSNECIWNFFEELKIMPFGHALEAKVMEIVEALFFGQRSEREPFWTNAAAQITRCVIFYMLYEADVEEDDSLLNHKEFCRLLDNGLESGNSDVYENYRTLLNSYDRFRTAGLFLPPIENGNMGPGVLTEILTMRSKLFNSAFAESISGRRQNRQRYISPGLLHMYSGTKVLFLEFNPLYKEGCSAVYRCFIDMLLTSYLDKEGMGRGKLYLFLDELALLPKLTRLADALNLGRSFGIRVIGGLQMVEQLKSAYNSNEHEANVLVGAFQNQIIFNSDMETIRYYQKLFGTALVQRSYVKPGGGAGISEPVVAETLETRTLQSLKRGEAVVHFAGKNAFITQFPKYVR